MLDLIKPEWPAPEHIHAYATTRIGGYSEPPYDTFNLADNVNDVPDLVVVNRALLKETLDLPENPVWLDQVHGNHVICVDTAPKVLQADGCFARLPNKVCVITTADCLPILLTNTSGSVVAALHAGWKGLAAGIIENGVKICQRKQEPLLAWFGPAIGPDSYEVGPEMREVFLKLDAQAEAAFKPSTTPGHWLANLYLLARLKLNKLGVDQIYGGSFDTFKDPSRFYSYRRDQAQTGRMATLIYMADHI